MVFFYLHKLSDRMVPWFVNYKSQYQIFLSGAFINICCVYKIVSSNSVIPEGRSVIAIITVNVLYWYNYTTLTVLPTVLGVLLFSIQLVSGGTVSTYVANYSYWNETDWMNHCVLHMLKIKTQKNYDWQIHEICSYSLLIVIYYIHVQITEIVLFKRSVIIFKIGKSLQVGAYYNFVTVYQLVCWHFLCCRV